MVPYKIIFNHDTTNILTCVSPYHKKEEDFTEEMLRASIDELGGIGIDAVTMCPGNGSVPWWQSRVYPNHYEWYTKRTSKKPGSFGNYIVEGGDMVKVFCEQCRKNDIAPILSLRLKDEHSIENLDHENVSRFFYEHQSWRINTHPDSPMGYRGLNWAIPEVRKERLAYIEELANNYDLDGFELDFMRTPPFFKLDETSYGQRERIMTEFIRNVRGILNKSPLKNKYLIIRIPNRYKTYRNLGIDVENLGKTELIDAVNISSSYVTRVEADTELIKNLAPNLTLFYELTHCSSRGPSPSWGMEGDDYPVRFTTAQQLYTAANLAYRRGADGISLFNFVYYRPYGRGAIESDFAEPPFEVIKNLRSPDFLEKESQHYWIPYFWQTGIEEKLYQLPKWFKRDTEHTIDLDLQLPKKDIKSARIRIAHAGGTPILSATEPIANTRGTSHLQWQAWLNGYPLESESDVSEPFEQVCSGFTLYPEQYSAWKVKKEYLKDKHNILKIKLIKAPIHDVFKVAVIYADLDIR